MHWLFPIFVLGRLFPILWVFLLSWNELRESNWAPARWSASWRSIWQLSPHLPSHSRQINYDAVSLPNHPPTWYADPIHQSRAGKLRSLRRNSCRGAVNCTHPREWCDGPCICFLFSFLYYFSLCVPKYYHFFSGFPFYSFYTSEVFLTTFVWKSY